MNKRNGFAKFGWKGLVLLGVAYLVLPLDFIPDVIPLLGIVDDVTVLALIAKAALHLFLKDREATPLPVRADRPRY